MIKRALGESLVISNKEIELKVFNGIYNQLKELNYTNGFNYYINEPISKKEALKFFKEHNLKGFSLSSSFTELRERFSFIEANNLYYLITI
jgi:hypothetical protein